MKIYRFEGLALLLSVSCSLRKILVDLKYKVNFFTPKVSINNRMLPLPVKNECCLTLLRTNNEQVPDYF